MNKNIEKATRIRKDRLDPNNYTIVLLLEAKRLGLIDQAGIDLFHSDLMLILAKLIIQYNHGESTSLRVETAQRILMSILYAIDACLGNFYDPQEALEHLQNHNLNDIYISGLDLLVTCLAETRQTYKEIVNTKMNMQNEAYNSTIDQAIPDFFKHYDVIYNAQDTTASIDYPLLFDDMRRQGVFYIKEYLDKLKMETQFCNLFTQNNINWVLINYGRVNHIDYRQALINVFEILLINSIFSVLSGNNAMELCISQNQYKLLKERLLGLDHTHCVLLINAAIEKLLNELHIDQPHLRNYITNFQAILMPRFFNALQSDNLANLVLIDEEIPGAEIMFDEGKSLNEEDFRAVFNQILECTNTIDKVSTINTNIKSLGDYIDLLEADCLFSGEFTTLFCALGDMDLSVLARIVFAEEIRIQPHSFSVQNLTLKCFDQQWKDEFTIFIQRLSPERLNSIDHYIHSSFFTGSWSYLE